MGIFSALNTAVSGLRAQSYAMENISGNIANSQTIGFKRTETSFVDMVADRPIRQSLSGSVRPLGSPTTTIQGDVRPTGIPTNLAINGNGFFSVSQITGYRDSVPIFSDSGLYTRRGDFEMDKDGYLVNQAGYFLKGDSISPTTGLITSANGILRVADDTVPAKATSQITYSATLPSVPATSRYNPNTPGSDLWPGGSGPVLGADGADFLSRTISGGSTTIYNDIGSPIDVQMRWAKLDATSGENTWALFYQNNVLAGPAEPMWTSLGEVTFGTNGTPTGPYQFGFPNPATINGSSIDDLTFTVGVAGLKQFANSNGLVQGLDVSSDGFPSGNLQSISITEDGRLFGIYSNGQSLPLARIAIAQFSAPNALKPRDGGAFEQTAQSGEARITSDGMRLLGGSVEASNADIAEEFTKMIVTQQAYSANTRVVTTAQQMMEQTINMIR